MRCEPTMNVEPPTRARGVHAQHRLARAAERVGEEQLGLHDAFERVGCLADDDRVDVGPRASRRRRARASRLRATDPGIETSARFFLWCVCPTPTTAQCSAMTTSPSMRHTRLCCRTWPPVACASPRFASTVDDPLRDFDDAHESGRHHRVGGERAARRVHVGVGAETERLAQDQLLRAERRRELDTSSGPPS